MDRTEPKKRAASVELIQKAFLGRRMVVSPQTLNEFYRGVVHKRKLVSRDAARNYLQAFYPVCTAPLDTGTHRLAYHLEDRYRLSWWDCVIMASALQANCRYFFSEDLQDGMQIETISVVSPFGSQAALLTN